MSEIPPNPFADSKNEPKPNPYQSPDFAGNQQAYTGGQHGLQSSILTQQRVVSILMIVQGTLSSLMGLMLLFAAVIMPIALAQEMKRNPNFNDDAPFDPRWLFLALYGGFGLCNLCPGILQIYAGIQGIKLKGHTLGIVALASGMLTVVSCYCFFTSLALLIYGLIIYLHDTTRKAYQLAKEGHTYETIMQMAMQRRY